MRVGVGLPTTTPGPDGALLVDWARTADAGPFSSLGVLDRLLYDSLDPFTSLAAAAAVTEPLGSEAECASPHARLHEGLQQSMPPAPACSVFARSARLVIETLAGATTSSRRARPPSLAATYPDQLVATSEAMRRWAELRVERLVPLRTKHP